jgi:hypothetical protein
MSPSRHATAFASIAALLLLAASLALPLARAAQDDESPATPPPPAAEPARGGPVERDGARPAVPEQGDEEPPLEFALELDGKSVDVQLDTPATAEVGGKQVEVRLTAKPDRLFRGGGISFRYPRQHGFEVERDPGGDGTTTWTFDGNQNVVILLRNAEPVDPGELSRDIIETMSEQYGKENSRTEPTSIELGSRKVTGTRMDVRVAGERLVQEVFAWQAREGEGPTYAMIIQDTPPEAGGTSEETRGVRELLARTFKHDPAPQK